MFILSLFLWTCLLHASEWVEGLEQIKHDIRSCNGNFECFGSWTIRYMGEVGSNQTLDLKMLPEGAFVTERTVNPQVFSVRLINARGLLTPLGNLKDIGVSIAVSDNVSGFGTGQCEIFVTFLATGTFGPINLERTFMDNRYNMQLTIDPPQGAKFLRYAAEKVYFQRAGGDTSPVVVTLKLFDLGRWYSYEASLPACVTTSSIVSPEPTCTSSRQSPCHEKITGSNGKDMLLVWPGFYQSLNSSREMIYLNSFYASDFVTNDEYARFLNANESLHDRTTDKEGHELIFENHPAISRGKYVAPERGILSAILGWPFRLFQRAKVIPFSTIEACQGEAPVAHVSWYAAHAYCRFYDLALPTEYQWEKFSLDLPEKKYVFGEWTGNWFSERLRVDFPLLNPKGPSDGTHRVAIQQADPTSLCVRNGLPPEFRSSLLGFRCVKNSEN